MEAIFGRASIVGRGWGLMMRSPGILATATVAAAPAEAASDKGGGDQQWNHSNARMRLRPNCHCSSTMRLRECSKELPRLFHWPSQQRMLASATPVRNEQNGGSGAGYSKRYSKQVQHKYNDGDDGGNDTGRQKYFKQHRDAEYHKDRPNRGRRAMRRGQEQGNVYKTGRHGETLVLHEGQWVGSDYFNERLQSATKRNSVAEAEKVYAEMVGEYRLQPDVGTFNHLISVHGRRGDADKAFKYYQQIKKRALEANGYTYTSLFNACATGRVEDHELAMKLFDELAKKEIAMHSFHFNALLKVCAKIGDDEGALDVFETMMAQNNAPGLPPCQPDSRTYSHLMSAYKRSADVMTAKDLIEVMVNTNIAVDAYVAVAFLAVCRSAMQKSKAIVTATRKRKDDQSTSAAFDVEHAEGEEQGEEDTDEEDGWFGNDDDGMDKLLASEAGEQPEPTLIQPVMDDEDIVAAAAAAAAASAAVVGNSGVVYGDNVVEHASSFSDDLDQRNGGEQEDPDEAQPTLMQAEVFDATQALVDAMKSSGNVVDEMVMEHMLGVVEEADYRQVTEAAVQQHLSWLQDIANQHNLMFDTRIANRWVSAYTRLGLQSEADATLLLMRDRGLQYDSYTVTALTSTPIRQGKFRESIGLLKYFVEQEGVVPSDITFTTLIRHLKQQASAETRRKSATGVGGTGNQSKWELAVMVLEYRLQLLQSGAMPPPDRFLLKESQQLVVRGKQACNEDALPLSLMQVINLTDALIKSTASHHR